MPSIYDILGYEALTGFMQKLEFSELEFVDLVPRSPVDGDIAKWQVVKPDITVHDHFVGRSGAAQPMRQSDWYEKTFTMPYRFTSKTFDAGLLAQLERPGTREYDSALTTVDSELRMMEQKVGAYTDNYLISQVIQGSMTIQLGTPGATVAKTIDFEIPAQNSFTNSGAWSGSTTGKPLTDFDTAIDIAGQYGVTLRHALMSNKTATNLARTDDVKNYIREYNAGRTVVETGELPPIKGIVPRIIRGRYAANNQTDGFMNKMIPDNTVIFVPEWPSAPRDWIELQEANFYVPNATQDGLTRGSVGGSATWGRTTDSPTGYTVFHKVARFPVIRKPWAIVKLTTT